MKHETLQVTGMHCASCSAIITKKLKKLPGVASCDVNFATEKATVSFNPKEVTVSQMNDQVQPLGYSLTSHHLVKQGVESMDHSEHLGLSQTKEQKQKELSEMLTKVEFVLPISLAIFSFMMWDVAAKVLPFVPNLPIPMQLFNTFGFVLSSVVLFWIGKPYIDAVIKFIQYHVANMDSLVGIGTLAAYIYSSTIFLFPAIQELAHLPEYTYFDVTIVVIGFITFGKYLEIRSKLRTGEAIEKLLTLQAKTAIVIRNNRQVELPIKQVVVGDIIMVKPGAKVPVDGIIISGSSAIDESMISGESLPKDKKPGDFVIGATINKHGAFRFKATKIGADTMLNQIVKMVETSQGSKAQIQNLADKVSAVFIPSVLAIAVITLLLWLSVGTHYYGFSTSLSYGLMAFVGILVIACPCALGLATPTAIIVGVGKGATSGILIKNAESLEKLHSVNTVTFDKTGTITTGKPSVTDIVVIDKNHDENNVVRIAGSLESNSQHPLAKAIAAYIEKKSLRIPIAHSFKEVAGIGVEGTINKKRIMVRKPIQKEQKDDQIMNLQKQGKTVVVVTENKKVIGAIAVSDTIKKDTKQVIQRLHAMGIKTVMLTGDNTPAALYIAKQVGIDAIHPEILPQGKSAIIKELQEQGNIVAMVGDGINDAPALTQANVGIAMATGSDIAIESSDITIVSGDITKIPQAIKLSRATMRTIKQNLFWAFVYNVIGIPLAAGALYPILGIFLNPVFAGLAMALSSVSVVSNSLLLKKIKI